MTSAIRMGRIATPLVVLSCFAALPAEATVARLLESDARHAIVELQPAAAVAQTIEGAEGRRYIRLTIPEFGAIDETGRPEVPTGSLRLAVPPGTIPRLRVLEQEWSELLPGAIVPVPRRVGVREPFGPDYVAEEVPEEGELYRSVTVYPETPFGLSPIKGLRNTRVVEVEYVGARAEVFARAHRLLRRAVLEITFDHDPARATRPSRRSARVDALWDRTARAGVLNATQAQAWAQGGPGDATSVGDTPWGAGDQWRVEIRSTGLTEIPFASLEAAGFPAGVPIADVAIYQRTFDIASVDDALVPAADLFVPLDVPAIARDRNGNNVFDAADGLLFWGRSTRDQWMTSAWEHEDRYDTRNFVWVRRDPAGGARMASRAGAIPTAVDSLAWTSFTVMHENDRLYTQYPGDFGPGREDFESEFYYWNNHLTPSNGEEGWPLSDSFVVRDPMPAMAATLRARVCPTGRSIATGFGSFTNLVTFSINGTQVGQRQFSNTSVYFTGPTPSPNVVNPALVLNNHAVPAGVLVDGANEFEFLGKSYAGSIFGPASAQARFLFDWYEVSYPRQLMARDDQLLLSTAAGGAAATRVRVRGFTSSADLLLLELTDPENPEQIALVPGQIEDVGGSFDLRFEHDNAAGAGRYLAARETSALIATPAEVARVGQPTLLAGGVGARWVGIAHDTLLSGTQELAAYRRGRQTAFAAPLSEVWDVFLNGRRDPIALKSFAAYAVQRWSDPLVFLLLVGDASEDHRGIGVDGDPDLVPSHSLWTDHEGAPEETDQYYAEVTEDGTGGFDDLPDLFVGRLALNTPEELAWNVERIRIYETQSGDELWRRKVLLLADDAFSGDLGGTVGAGYEWQGVFEKGFCNSSRDYAESLNAHPVDDLLPEVMCLSDFTSPCADSCYEKGGPVGAEFYLHDCEALHGGDCGIIYDCRLTPQQWGDEYDCVRATIEPIIVPEIRNRLNDGVLIWNYQGHANKYFLAHEVIWRDDVLDDTRRDVNSLHNDDRPFIFLGFACHLAEFDRADERVNEDCMSEKLMNVRTADQESPGGAVAAFASSGYEFLSPNLYLNEIVLDAFFYPERTSSGPVLPDDGSIGYVWTLGEATTRARILYQSLYPGDSQFRQAASRFVLLGDPALSPDVASPMLTVKVDGVPVENPARPFFVRLEDHPDSLTVEVVASDGRGIVQTRVVDTSLGVIPPEAYQVVTDLETADGVPQRVTMTRRFALRPNEEYEVKFETVDSAGKTSTFTVSTDNTFVFEDPPAAFPNPFDEATSVAFYTNGTPRSASLHVYTVAGRKIREVHRNDLTANEEQVLEWDGRDDHGLSVANGTYLLRVTVTGSLGSVSETLPVVRIK